MTQEIRLASPRTDGEPTHIAGVSLFGQVTYTLWERPTATIGPSWEAAETVYRVRAPQPKAKSRAASEAGAVPVKVIELPRPSRSMTALPPTSKIRPSMSA